MVGIGGSNLIPYGNQSALHTHRPDGTSGVYIRSKTYELKFIVDIVYFSTIMSDTGNDEMNGIGTDVYGSEGFGRTMHRSSFPPAIGGD
jgi:hypothetical protein